MKGGKWQGNIRDNLKTPLGNIVVVVVVIKVCIDYYGMPACLCKKNIVL